VNEFTAEFEFEKETKNTVRFKETSKVPRIGTIYIQKSALDGANIKEIVVTVKWAE
jgi:hypothetical protein